MRELSNDRFFKVDTLSFRGLFNFVCLFISLTLIEFCFHEKDLKDVCEGLEINSSITKINMDDSFSAIIVTQLFCFLSLYAHWRSRCKVIA